MEELIMRADAHKKNVLFYFDLPLFLTTLLTIALMTGPAWSDSVNSAVHQGNVLYAEGSFNDAIKEYDRAIAERPEAMEPEFNKADCYYRLDDLENAMGLYKKVAAECKNMQLVAKARYNLGNSYFKQGLKQRDSNLQKGVEFLSEAIVHWRQVLGIQPENKKAAKNIEITRLIIKDILDQINKQKEKQKQQAQKQKKMEDKLRELVKEQKALAEKTDKTNSDLRQGDINAQRAQKKYTAQAAEQSELRNRASQISKELIREGPNTPPATPQMQQASGELNAASENQASAVMKLNTSDGGSASNEQDKAIEHIENAIKALSQKSRQNQKQTQHKQQQSQEKQGQKQEQQPAEQQEDKNKESRKQKAAAPDTTAQQILDKERRQRKQRQLLRTRGRYREVEKDW